MNNQHSHTDIAWKLNDRWHGLKRFMTDKQYQAQSDTIKRYYEPFYCAHCKQNGTNQ